MMVEVQGRRWRYSMKKLAVIGVPSSAGARRVGQDQAPQSFRTAGIIERLRAKDFELTDFADLEHVVFQPDPKNPKQQNLALVSETCKQVARKVSEALREQAKIIVLGGDCTITLGVLAGLIEELPKLGLIYFDGDVDLNTPETTTSGIFDGMVMSHIIGHGSEALTRIGPRYPLMNEEDIVLFGYNAEAGWIDAPELDRLTGSSMLKYPLKEIRGNKAAALAARNSLESKADGILVHFDVDVIDSAEFAAADVLHTNGLSFDEAIEALRVFVSSPKFVGLVITEFN
jgi:arginase